MDKYEYIWGKVTRNGYVLLMDDNGVASTEERSFNELGAEGWELYSPGGNVAYFKRRTVDSVVPPDFIEFKAASPAPAPKPPARRSDPMLRETIRPVPKPTAKKAPRKIA